MQTRLAKVIPIVASLVLAVVTGTNPAYSQVVDDTGAWFALFSNGDIESDQSNRLRWWFDGHVRTFDDTNGFGQSIMRPGIGYRLSDSATVWAGYGWINTSPAGPANFDEHRIWQQLTWSEDLDGTSLGFRSRLEQRLLETGSDTGWRFRQLVSARRPLAGSPNLSFVAWDEIFVHLNDTDWGAQGGFDQNRLFLGLGFKQDPNSPVRVEVGYLNQFIDRLATHNLCNHLISVNLFWNP